MSRRAAAQSGFSLVELMVAMTIGLLITMVIAEMFVGNKRTHTVQDENARMQENARFALSLLSRQIRIAGFKRSECASGTCFFDAGNPMITGQNDVDLHTSDRVSVQAFGSDNAAGAAADNSVVDCLGNGVRQDARVNDTYYIAADAANNNEPTLYCLRAGDAAGSPLIPGVESMQILYGEDSNTADGLKAADRYLPAGNAALQWDRVVSVRISMVLRSGEAASPSIVSRKYNHFGQQYAPADNAPVGDPGAVFNSAGTQLDFKLRRIFQTTIALRNRVN
jgi:type IV pilus assembly protein PilW